jgi:hypothetical protein
MQYSKPSILQNKKAMDVVLGVGIGKSDSFEDSTSDPRPSNGAAYEADE